MKNDNAVTSRELFWKIKQKYEKICEYCVKGCQKEGIDKNEKIVFWESLRNVCKGVFCETQIVYDEIFLEEEQLSYKANQLYLKGHSFAEVNEVINEETAKKMTFIKNALSVDMAYKQGYMPFGLNKYGADLFFYTEHIKFFPCKEGENPYLRLKNINKRENVNMLTLDEKFLFFDEILLILGTHKSLTDIISGINQLLKRYGFHLV